MDYIAHGFTKSWTQPSNFYFGHLLAISNRQVFIDTKALRPLKKNMAKVEEKLTDH